MAPVGYDHADYYYMPDIDAYYDVNAHSYIYYNNNVWVHSGALPPRYAGYDMYHGYKVVINHPAPWRNAGMYRAKYAQYKGRRDQNIIRDSRDDHYRNHWHQDNGHHYGNRNPGGGNRGYHRATGKVAVTMAAVTTETMDMAGVTVMTTGMDINSDENMINKKGFSIRKAFFIDKPNTFTILRPYSKT